MRMLAFPRLHYCTLTYRCRRRLCLCCRLRSPFPPVRGGSTIRVVSFCAHQVIYRGTTVASLAGNDEADISVGGDACADANASAGTGNGDASGAD